MIDPQAETDAVISLLRDEIRRALALLEDMSGYFLENGPLRYQYQIKIRMHAISIILRDLDFWQLNRPGEQEDVDLSTAPERSAWEQQDSRGLPGFLRRRRR